MSNALVRLSVNDDFRSALEREGYVVLTDLFDQLEVVALQAAVCELFEQVLSLEAARGRELIGKSYYTDRARWQAAARQMHNLLEVMDIAANARVRRMLRAAGLKKPVACIHPEMRVDVPKDHQYRQPWHQDWRSGQGSLNALTIWMPLHDVTSEDGAIELLPGSHLWGLTETEELSNPRRFVCKDSRLETATGLIAEIRQGEAVLFSQMLVHRSGSNIGKLPRLTAQLRYADVAEQNFQQNLFRAPSGSEMVWASAPTADDMQRIYSGSS